MDKNYIVLDGNKIELSDEQIEQISEIIEVPKKNPFKNYQDDFMYPYIIDVIGRVRQSDLDVKCLERKCNAFYDRNCAQQVALHRLLNRKLLKYAYENDAICDTIMSVNKPKYYIAQNPASHIFTVLVQYLTKSTDVYFSKEIVAHGAISEVIIPFMKEHPDFVW